MPGGVADPRRGVAARLLRPGTGPYTRRMRRPRLLPLALAAVAASLPACSSGSGGTGGGATTTTSTTTTTTPPVIGGSRPVTVHVPSSYKAGTPVPLVMMLHGYGFQASIEEAYL